MEYLNFDILYILFIFVAYIVFVVYIMVPAYIAESNRNDRILRDINCLVLTALVEYSTPVAPAA